MAQNWNAWGTSWGLSWDGYWGTLDVLPEDTPDYGHATNPNLKLQRIVDIKVRGTGGQMVVSGGRGGTYAEQERRYSVQQYGTGAKLQLRPGRGSAKTTVSIAQRVSGNGQHLRARAGRGAITSGCRNSGIGNKVTMRFGAGRCSTGISVSGGGGKLSISAGTIDDVFVVKNPTDEELAILALRLTSR